MTTLHNQGHYDLFTDNERGGSDSGNLLRSLPRSLTPAFYNNGKIRSIPMKEERFIPTNITGIIPDSN